MPEEAPAQTGEPAGTVESVDEAADAVPEGVTVDERFAAAGEGSYVEGGQFYHAETGNNAQDAEPEKEFDPKDVGRKFEVVGDGIKRVTSVNDTGLYRAFRQGGQPAIAGLYRPSFEGVPDEILDDRLTADGISPAETATLCHDYGKQAGGIGKWADAMAFRPGGARMLSDQYNGVTEGDIAAFNAMLEPEARPDAAQEHETHVTDYDGRPVRVRDIDAWLHEIRSWLRGEQKAERERLSEHNRAVHGSVRNRHGVKVIVADSAYIAQMLAHASSRQLSDVYFIKGGSDSAIEKKLAELEALGAADIRILGVGAYGDAALRIAAESPSSRFSKVVGYGIRQELPKAEPRSILNNNPLRTAHVEVFPGYHPDAAELTAGNVKYSSARGPHPKAMLESLAGPDDASRRAERLASLYGIAGRNVLVPEYMLREGHAPEAGRAQVN